MEKLTKPSSKRIDVELGVNTHRKWIALCKYDKETLSWKISNPEVFYIDHNLKLGLDYSPDTFKVRAIFSDCPECLIEGKIYESSGLPSGRAIHIIGDWDQAKTYNKLMNEVRSYILREIEHPKSK
jgi:hypothetical protein